MSSLGEATRKLTILWLLLGRMSSGADTYSWKGRRMLIIQGVSSDMVQAYGWAWSRFMGGYG